MERENNEGNAAYGVIVTKPDGSRIEVHLDQNNSVLGTQPAGQDRDNDSDQG